MINILRLLHEFQLIFFGMNPTEPDIDGKKGMRIYKIMVDIEWIFILKCYLN